MPKGPPAYGGPCPDSPLHDVPLYRTERSQLQVSVLKTAYSRIIQGHFTNLKGHYPVLQTFKPQYNQECNRY